MGEAVTQGISIAADPSTVLDVIIDIESYPDWQDEIRSAEVLETDEQGRPRRARMAVDAKLFTATYVLRYEYTGSGVSWSLEESDQLRELIGAYDLQPRDDGATDVTYHLTVEPKIPVPGLLRRQAAKRIIDGALKGLRRRVEGSA